MASEKKLDCVILGLLSREALTGYEIKKRMDSSLKTFWGASYGSIYPTLSGLVERGFALKREDTDNGRIRLIYTITEQGRLYLDQWLRLPVERDEMRFETLLKVFFGMEAGPEQTIEQIEAFRLRTERELLYLLGARQLLMKSEEPEESRLCRQLSINFGIRTYRAFLEWCREAEGCLRENLDK